MKVIIAGGGRLGQQLAKMLADSVIIEIDHSKIAHLVNEFGPERVVRGSATKKEVLEEAGIEEADAVVVATNNDKTNYHVALHAEEYDVPKIVARVDDPENMDIFHQIGIETIICPAVKVAEMISASFFPQAREVREMVVLQDSPLCGKEVRELDLPEYSMVAAIMRGNHFVKPQDDLTLQKGDHVIVCSPPGVRFDNEEIHAPHEELRPFGNILAVIRDSADIPILLDECFCLSTTFEIVLDIVVTSDELKEEIEKALRSEFASVDVEVRKIKNLAEVNELVRQEYPETDCVALRLTKEDKPLIGTSGVVELLNNSKIPVLISKATCPYKDVITLMGCEATCERTSSLGLKVSLLHGGGFHLMTYGDFGPEESESVLHMKRVGKVYGLEVTTESVEGNPTIELVSKVSSGDYDLIVANWNSPILRKDIIKKMIFEAPMSVLVYTE